MPILNISYPFAFVNLSAKKACFTFSLLLYLLQKKNAITGSIEAASDFCYNGEKHEFAENIRFFYQKGASMIRLFEQHYIRNARELDGMWNFHMEGFDKDYRLPVPGCWEQHPDFPKHRGTGTYTKKIYIRKSGAVRLEFKGVSHTADVFFDGIQIAHHYNAFTPFSSIIKNVSKGEHEIKVIVDNTFGEHSALHIPNDYYTYGGITRPVALECISDIYIKKLHFLPYLKDNSWHAKIDITICNLSDKAADFSLTASLSPVSDYASQTVCQPPEEAPLTAMQKLPADSETTLSFDEAFPYAAAWSNTEPNLYYLNTVLFVNDEAIDDLIERVGFRTVSVNGSHIEVNGEAVFLKGFNRHEDFAIAGCAIPLQLMAHDMELMQDMGANALRTSHYPNDERFLDLCDECGIFVWEENHARAISLERMQNPNFDRQCEDCNSEMIENHYNHPSIIIWGILNECASDTKEGRDKYQRQFVQLKRLDASRPTTFATCRHFTDICLDLPDIVSYNLYSGWYESLPTDIRNTQEIDWIRQSGGADKPIIVSEFGAGAMYGYRDRTHCKWSEEYQADLLRENLDVYMNEKNICGVFIWLFADCRVTEEEWFTRRARCHNNKGVVDEYRRPKLAYDVVKEIFHK